METSIIIGFLLAYLFFILLFFALSVIMYVFTSLSLYTIAKRRKISCYGLAWVPVGSDFILGAIADKYQALRTGKKSYYRFWLISFAALFFIEYISFFIYIISFTIKNTVQEMPPQFSKELSLSIFASLIIFYIVFLLTAIIYSVIKYVCIYKVFMSCKPQNAVLYLLLSIFVSVTYPFLMFSCRKYDAFVQPVNLQDGMYGTH